jgi:tetratricopeptide (TPR) repeat protein
MTDLSRFIRLAAIWLISFLIPAGAALQAQTTPPAAQSEVVSLLGVKHYAQTDEKGEVKAAEQKLAADPKNVELIIALGRAQGSIWRFRDAIATYTRGIKLAPNNAALYRHRGHRYISTRQFDKAVADLERAAKLYQSDLPMSLGFDIWYHLGLAHYLKGEFAKAAAAYERCREFAEKDDSIIAVSDWLYMTYRRQGKTAEAARVLERITPQMQVKENKTYFDRLMLYKGLKQEADLINLEKATDLEIATVGYGVANWHLYNGNATKADEYFRKIVAGKAWSAFGFIAAEVELARKKKG